MTVEHKDIMYIGGGQWVEGLSCKNHEYVRTEYRNKDLLETFD